MKITDKYLVFTDREEWRAWLETYHATEQEAWLLHSKKKAAKRFLALEEAVEEALCFGWIDGVLKPMDSETYALRYSPRKLRSVWSINNQQRAEKMIREGRMTSAGLEKITQAKENGEWDATLVRENVGLIAEELVLELKQHRAWTSFKKWPVSSKKQYLYWLNSAKKPETRQKRIHTIVEMAKRKQGSKG
ncbi:MAG: hypothetical protein H6Q37_1106 [Chloroflexi bacterium]|nr:hypothetical protein [Chloroflexota bacterium]